MSRGREHPARRKEPRSLKKEPGSFHRRIRENSVLSVSGLLPGGRFGSAFLRLSGAGSLRTALRGLGQFNLFTALPALHLRSSALLTGGTPLGPLAAMSPAAGLPALVPGGGIGIVGALSAPRASLGRRPSLRTARTAGTACLPILILILRGAVRIVGVLSVLGRRAALGAARMAGAKPLGGLRQLQIRAALRAFRRLRAGTRFRSLFASGGGPVLYGGRLRLIGRSLLSAGEPGESQAHQ